MLYFGLDSTASATTRAVRARNAALDRMFYDVGNLTPEEYAMLIAETTLEGSILIVWPSGAKGDNGIGKFGTYRALRAQPGKLLRRFAIAGVGSSDVGAAAFARTVADRYDEPVGAIIAGYGVADLIAEALGGWFVLGAANRLMRAYHVAVDRTSPGAGGPGPGIGIWPGAGDSETLLRLLLDDDRRILSVAGHSKGSLSIAYALEKLAGDATNWKARDRAMEMRITTAGAVVEFPNGFENVGQYLGSVDWFGRMNSRPGVDHETVPGAWHHLNTAYPMHMDFADILSREP